jgi:hypothetical protein
VAAALTLASALTGLSWLQFAPQYRSKFRDPAYAPLEVSVSRAYVGTCWLVTRAGPVTTPATAAALRRTFG